MLCGRIRTVKNIRLTSHLAFGFAHVGEVVVVAHISNGHSNSVWCNQIAKVAYSQVADTRVGSTLCLDVATIIRKLSS